MSWWTKATGFVKKQAKGIYDAAENVVSGTGKAIGGAFEGDLSKVGKGFAEAAGGAAGLATANFTGGLINAAQAGQVAESGINYATLNFKAGSETLTSSGALGSDPLAIRAKAAAEAEAKAAADEAAKLADAAEKTALAKERASLLSLKKQVGLGKKTSSTSIGGTSAQSSMVAGGTILG